MMKKQEFVPREISEKPLYELKSVEDIPVSEPVSYTHLTLPTN